MNQQHDDLARATRVSDRVVELERTFGFSPERVFDAWTNPVALRAWWGPDGFDTVTQTQDFRVGGSWIFQMIHPEHGSFDNHVRYTAIEPGRRIAYEQGRGDAGGTFTVNFTVEARFTPEGDGTRLTMRMEFPDAGSCSYVIDNHGAMEGGRQTLTRLAALLQDRPLADFDPALDLVLERRVPVPIDKVWRAWTRPELLVQWFTPKPWTTESCEIDMRPGGRFRTVMCGPDGERHEGDGCWLEVVHHRRLVFTDALQPGYRPATSRS